MVRFTNEKTTTLVERVLKAVDELTLKQGIIAAISCSCITSAITIAVAAGVTPVIAVNGSGDDNVIVTEETTSTKESTTTTTESTTTTTTTTMESTTTTTTTTMESTTTTTTETTMMTTTTETTEVLVLEEAPEEFYDIQDGSVVFDDCGDDSVTVAVTPDGAQENAVDENALDCENTNTSWYYGISEGDENFILLCNAVGHEAGSSAISVEDKAKVVEVICNRMESASYPDTIYDVLTQQNQFSGAYSYVDLGTYSAKVTEDVKTSVRNYLSGSYENHGYFSFYGDGCQNHFR